MSGHLFLSFNPNSSFKDILKYWGPYVVHFKHRDSAYVVHIISRDSTFVVHFKCRDCPLRLDTSLLGKHTKSDNFFRRCLLNSMLGL